LAVLLGAQTHCHFAIALEWHDEILFERDFNENHVVCGRKPDIIENILE
jgi:hypothetical protein